MKSGVPGYKQTPATHVAEDVARVRAKAFLVLEFDEDPETPTVIENTNGMYNVIAVIGPGVGLPGTPAAGQYFPKAVLCEIGISRGRPYAPSFRRNKKTGAKRWAPQRRKWFQISVACYRKALGVILFDYMQLLADMRIEKWKDFETYIRVSTVQLLHVTTTNELVGQRGWKKVEKGARFTISRADSRVISDLYAYVFCNEGIMGSVADLASLIDLQLSRHRNGFKTFKRLKAASNLRKILASSSLPRYLKIEALKLLPPETRAMFGEHLAEMIGWDGVSCPERELAGKARDYGERIKGTRLRLVREKRGQIVVEVFASQSVRSRMEERLVS